MWFGWWAGMFFQGIIINGAVFYLLTSIVLKWKSRNIRTIEWQIPSSNTVKFTFIVLFLILFSFFSIAYGFSRMNIEFLLLQIVQDDIRAAFSTGIKGFVLLHWISVIVIFFMAFIGYHLSINWTESLRASISTQNIALFESEKRFIHAIENSTDEFVIYDNQLRYKYVNKRAIKRMGISSIEIIGKTDEDLFPDSISSHYLPSLKKALETGKTQTNEYSYNYFGEKFSFAATHIPILNSNGEVEEIFGISFDISERKRYEEKLQELEFIVNKSQAIAFLWRAQDGWPVEYVSDNIIQFGYNVEEILKKGFYYATIIHTDDYNRVKSEVEHYSETGIIEFMQEYRIYTRSETVRWVEDRTWIRKNAMGVITHYQGIIIDITEKKLAEQVARANEERFRIVAKTTNDVIWDWDIPNNSLWWNEGFSELFGYELDKIEPGIESWSNRLHPEDRTWVYKSIEDVFEDVNQHYWEAEYRFLKSDNSFAYILDRGFVLRDKNGKAYRMVGAMIDMTERKLSEEKLHKREEEFRALVENTPDIITRFDRQLRHVYVNPAIEKSIGVPPSVFIGKTHAELNIAEHLTKMWTELLNSVFETGKEISHEFTFDTPAGKRFFFSTIVPEHNKKGEIENVVSIARDFTANKIAEEALKKSEERWRLLFKQNPLPMWVYDIETLRIVAVNFAAVHSYGYSREEFLQMTIKDIRPPEDIPRLMDVISHPERRYNKAGVWKHIKKDGTIIDAEVTSNDIEFNDRPARLVLSNDVTEKLKAEQALLETNIMLSHTLESLNEAVFVVDSQSREIISCNTAAEKLTGYSARELIGNTTQKLYICEEDYLHFALQGKTKWETEGASSGEYKFKKKDGTIIHCEFTVKLLNLIGPKKSFVVSVLRDISERKRHIEELLEYQNKLRALAGNLQSAREAERAAIAREIHDEIGQVLTSLKMNLTLINKHITTDGSNIDLQKISREISLLNQTIDSSVKRIRKLITSLRPEVLDSLGLLSALEWQVNEFKVNTQIDCEFNCSVAEITFPDEIAIGIFRIFQESLTNVARHSNATKVTINIFEDGDKFMLDISDNGKGISEENISHSDTFGLISMRERAFILGGELMIGGIEEGGTRVRLYVPAKEIVKSV